MLPDIPREYTQTASLVFIIAGIILLITGLSPIFGVACIGFSCWILMMSESVLHNKIQVEMSRSLDSMRKKQESNIQDLLYFLQRSKSMHSPWESIEGAKSYIKKIEFPASVMGADGFAIDVNDYLLSTLGYERVEFLKTPAPMLHREDLYGSYLQGIERNIAKGKRFMHSRFAFLHKDGHEIVGSIAVIILPDRQGGVGIFLPDKDSIINTLKK